MTKTTIVVDNSTYYLKPSNFICDTVENKHIEETQYILPLFGLD